MEEMIKALGPWPTLQGIAIGMIVAGVGVWAIVRGLQGRGRDVPMEDAKAKWEQQTQLKHIHENAFKIVDLLKEGNDLQAQILAAINRFNDNRWNAKQ